MSRWNDRGLRRLAWATWSLTVLCSLLGVVDTAAGALRDDAAWGSSAIGEYVFAFVVLSFSLVGVVIALRQPRNRIGWWLMAVGLAWGLPGLLDIYAVTGLVLAPGALPGPEVAAALNEGTWAWGTVAMGVFVILLFPDGRLPSPRWAVVAWLAGLAAVLVPVGIALTPGPIDEASVPGLTNPLVVPALTAVADVLVVVGIPMIPLTIVAAAASLVTRFRHSRGVQREQVKWLAAAGSIVAALFAVTLAATFLAELAAPERVPWHVQVLQQASLVSFLLLPLAIGAAVLRYRLYDIDVVINRALVYGTLTATLAGGYLGSVLLLQLLLRPVTSDSDLAVAASTLAVAAAFRPARRGIQEQVDRRFYRRRYDARLAVEAFVGRLRTRLDVDGVDADLLLAVRETVVPTHASVWLAASGEVSP